MVHEDARGEKNNKTTGIYLHLGNCKQMLNFLYAQIM